MGVQSETGSCRCSGSYSHWAIPRPMGCWRADGTRIPRTRDEASQRSLQVRAWNLLGGQEEGKLFEHTRDSECLLPLPLFQVLVCSGESVRPGSGGPESSQRAALPSPESPPEGLWFIASGGDPGGIPQRRSKPHQGHRCRSRLCNNCQRCCPMCTHIIGKGDGRLWPIGECARGC